MPVIPNLQRAARKRVGNIAKVRTDPVKTQNAEQAINTQAENKRKAANKVGTYGGGGIR